MNETPSTMARAGSPLRASVSPRTARSGGFVSGRGERTGAGGDHRGSLRIVASLVMSRGSRMSRTVSPTRLKASTLPVEEARRQRQPRRVEDVVDAVADEVAPAWAGRLHAEAEKAQARLLADRPRDPECRHDDEGTERVREHVAAQDAPMSGAECAARRHVVELADDERRTARQPHEDRQLRETDGDDTTGRPEPASVTTMMASRSVGKDNSTSTALLTAVSSQPPRKPAARPSGVPRQLANSTEHNPMTSAGRVP